MTSRRIALAVLVLVAILAGLAGFYLREPPASADSIERVPAYQNEALLARAWVLPDRKGISSNRISPFAVPPASPTSCVPKVSRPIPLPILSRSGALRIFGFLPFGLTLEEEAGLLERETGKSVKELRDLSLESFRAEIAKSNDPSRRIIINFLRTPLFGRGHGHFSPVLGYLPAEDLVFVGDVNANYRPWLVPTSRLFDAQNTIDSSSHAKRGLLEVEAR